jgi:hypothetical protein
MAYIIEFRQNRQRRKPQRLLYRSGVTPDEVRRLIEEVGREQVEAVIRALDLPIGPELVPAAE